MTIPFIRLKKGEDRRLKGGHPWVYSNEINTSLTPLKSFTPGEIVHIESHDQQVLGTAYINPHSLITARLFSKEPNAQLDSAFFNRYLQTALALRTTLFDQPYYRLVFSEADDLPGLVVDRFNRHLVIQVNTAGMEAKTDFIVDALCSLLPDTESVLLRNDSSMRTHEGLTSYVKAAFGTPPAEIVLKENGVSFATSLWEGQKTGWFYDHRMNRARLGAYVKDKKVLDVFSYLGGWGIQAACDGASNVDCIDASAPACRLIEKNAQLNQVADKVNVECSDAFDALKNKLKEKVVYDVIILDPPAFVKRAKDKKEGTLAYQRLNEMALNLLAPGGVLVSCSCSMHLSHDDLLDLIKRAAYRANCPLQIVEQGHQGPDHPIHLLIPETNYLKAIWVRKRG